MFPKEHLQGPRYIQGQSHVHRHIQYRQEEGVMIIEKSPKISSKSKPERRLSKSRSRSGSRKIKETYDGNKSPPRNKSIQGSSSSITKSNTQISGRSRCSKVDDGAERPKSRSKSPDSVKIGKIQMFPQRHCDKREILSMLINRMKLSVPVKRQSRLRSKSRSRSQSTPKRGNKNASRKVDTSLETSIDTSQNLNDSRACSKSLTIDEREEDSLSSGTDSQNNGYNGTNLSGRQLDKLPSPRRKSLRNRTEVMPPNPDSLLERTSMDEGHTPFTDNLTRNFENSMHHILGQRDLASFLSILL